MVRALRLIPFARIRSPLIWFLCGAIAACAIRWRASAAARLMAQRGVIPAELDRPVRAEFHQTPVATALRQLGEQAQCPIAVRWPVLAMFSVFEDTPVNGSFNNVPLSAALRDVLAQAGGNLVWIDFRAHGRSVIVSTARDLMQEEMILGLYDISDIIKKEAQRSREMRWSLGSSAAVPLDTEFDQAGSRVALALSSFQRDPRAFRESNNFGWISVWHGRLVVYDTPDCHAKIRDALERIRRSGLP